MQIGSQADNCSQAASHARVAQKIGHQHEQAGINNLLQSSKLSALTERSWHLSHEGSSQAPLAQPIHHRQEQLAGDIGVGLTQGSEGTVTLPTHTLIHQVAVLNVGVSTLWRSLQHMLQLADGLHAEMQHQSSCYS